MGKRTVGGQQAADALLDSWELFAGAVDGAQLYDGAPGVLGAVTAAPVPEMNGVWLRSTRAEPRVVEEVLDRVAASGLPHCLQSRPGADAGIAGLAAARGMTAAGEVPLMVRDGQSAPRVDSPGLDRAGTALPSPPARSPTGWPPARRGRCCSRAT